MKSAIASLGLAILFLTSGALTGVNRPLPQTSASDSVSSGSNVTVVFKTV